MSAPGAPGTPTLGTPGTPTPGTSAPDATRRRVLIVGYGYVGEELGARLVAGGHEVWGLRRAWSELAQPAPALPADPTDGATGTMDATSATGATVKATDATAATVRRIAADVTTGAGLERLPRDIEALVYCVSPGERTEDAYQRVYVEGLARVLERLSDARPLLVSSTAVYGENEGEVDESTRPTPAQPTAARLLDAEALALGRPSAVVLRASGIYGPGRTRLLARLARGELTPTEREHLTHRVHRDDLARALRFFLERPALTGVYVATDEEPATLGALQDWLSTQELPRALLTAPTRQPRAGRSATERRLTSKKLRSAGFEFSYPSFREGYGAILRELLAREKAEIS